MPAFELENFYCTKKFQTNDLNENFWGRFCFSHCDLNIQRFHNKILNMIQNNPVITSF